MCPVKVHSFVFLQKNASCSQFVQHKKKIRLMVWRRRGILTAWGEKLLRSLVVQQ